MELDWTQELTAVCAALATTASDQETVDQAATRAHVAIGTVSFPKNGQGRWQALIQAAAAQDKLFALLRDLREMYPERAAELGPAVVQYQPNFDRVAAACEDLREYLEPLRTPDDLLTPDLGDIATKVRELFDLDDQWQEFLRRPVDLEGRDVRAARRARRLFRSRVDTCLTRLHVYRDVIRRRDAIEPFGAREVQALGEVGAQAKLALLRAVEDLVNLREDFE